MHELAAYSEVDTQRFGKRIYRATLRDVDDVAALASVAEAQQIDMLIARCPVGEARLVHALEQHDYLLMDTLLYYAGPSRAFEQATWDHSIREATRDDRDAVEAVATDAFTNYDGHYHADPRLDPKLATLGYVDWCMNCLKRQDHTVWIAADGPTVMGFIAVHSDEGAADVVLNGVASSFRRRRVYESLLKAAGREAFRRGFAEVRSSTHLGNLAPQRAWIKNGMSIVRAVYAFHKWFDR